MNAKPVRHPQHPDASQRCGYVILPLLAVLLPILVLAVIMRLPQQLSDGVRSSDSRQQDEVVRQDADREVDEEAIRFEAVDVFIDSGESALAAWQCELSDPSGRVSIVGIEGGEHDAFSDPPHYDPAAMMNDRVILAAYSTSDELPSGLSRVARVNIRIKGEGDVEFSRMLSVSASRDGESIPAELTIGKATL